MNKDTQYVEVGVEDTMVMLRGINKERPDVITEADLTEYENGAPLTSDNMAKLLGKITTMLEEDGFLM